MGLSFPLLLRHVMEEKNDKKQIGQLFAYNTLGGLLGSLAAGFIFLPEFGVSASLAIAAVINLSVAVSIKTKFLFRRTAIVIIMLAVSVSINLEIDPHAMGSFYNASNYKSIEEFAESIEISRSKSKILYSDFGVYGHVCVFEAGPFKHLYINGKPDGSTSLDVTTQLMIGYIPMLLHDNPKNVAVVGLGSGLTAGATLQFNIDALDVYEINPGVVEANKYFAEDNHQALSNPKTKIVIGDARRNLSVSEKTYDVIISEPSNPWVEGEGFLFTKEYYDIVDKSLSEKGIFVQWVGAYDYTVEAFNILMNTLHIKFPYIQLWSDGLDFYIITSREPKRFNYTNARKHINKPAIKADLEFIELFETKHLNPVDLFFSFYISDYIETGETRINTDDNSIIEFSTGRFSGRSLNHVKRLFDDQMKTFPVDLDKNDMDIEFETSLPLFNSKYSFIQFGKRTVISKQVIFKDEAKTLFVQTTTQPEKPTLAQAQALAKNFNAALTESDEHLFNLKGANSNGVIGYCAEKRMSYLLFSTLKAPVNAVCK